MTLVKRNGEWVNLYATPNPAIHGNERHDITFAADSHTHAAHAARVWLGSAQSIANQTFEKVLVDTVTDDPDGLFDSANNEIVADKTGWWLVLIGVGFQQSGSGNRRIPAIAHNGSRTARQVLPPAGSNSTMVAVADIVKAISGDTFEAQAWQDSGGSLGLRAVETDTWLSAAYLGSA